MTAKTSKIFLLTAVLLGSVAINTSNANDNLEKINQNNITLEKILKQQEQLKHRNASMIVEAQRDYANGKPRRDVTYNKYGVVLKIRRSK